MGMVYQWKITMPVDANVAGKELERIEKRDGSITPEALLKASRRTTAPLHSCFEWDDTVAAEKYRLDQAKYIIRNIVIKEETSKQPEVRGFVHVVVQDKKQYVSVHKAMSSEELRKQVLDTAMRELRAFREKYQNLNELASVFAEIDKLVA